MKYLLVDSYEQKLILRDLVDFILLLCLLSINYLTYLFLIEQRTTPQGQVYYFHTQTGVSTWHDPRVPRSVTVLISSNKIKTFVCFLCLVI